MQLGGEHIASILVRRWVVLSVVLGLLLVPATCVNAAGPHSLFQSPMPAHVGTEHHSAADHDAEMSMHDMSAEEHAGHHHAGNAKTAAQAEPAAPPERDPVTPAPGGRISDLPATMAMAAISNPAVTADLEPIELPGPPSAPAPKTAERLFGEIPALELPPPR